MLAPKYAIHASKKCLQIMNLLNHELQQKTEHKNKNIITDDGGKKMYIRGKQVNDLADFEYDVNGEQFVKLFIRYGGTKHMAEHLWDKFHGYNHSILRLWKALDGDNQEIMEKVLKAWSPRIKNHIQKQEV